MELANIAVQIELAINQPRRYTIQDGGEGWFLSDPLATMSQQQQLWCNYLDNDWTGSESLPELAPGVSLPAVIPLVQKGEHGPDVEGCILRPFIPHLAGAAGIASFKNKYGFWPDRDTYWNFVESDDKLFVNASQSAEQLSYTQWRFDQGTGYHWSTDNYTIPSIIWFNPANGMSPNVFFLAGVSHPSIEAAMDTTYDDVAEEVTSDLDAEGAPEDLTTILGSNPGYTKIVFGGGKWALCIPPSGAPSLWERASNFIPPGSLTVNWPTNWIYRPWTGGKLKEVKAETLAKQYYDYKIGGVDNHIIVTDGNFEDGFAYYTTPYPSPAIPAGWVAIIHWPGPAAFHLTQLYMSHGEVERVPVHVGNVRLSDISTSAFGSPTNTDTWQEADCGVEINPIEVPNYPDHVRYLAFIEPNYHDDGGGYYSFSSPLVQNIILYQNVNFTDNGAPVYTTMITPYSMTGDLELDSVPQTYRLNVDNRMALDATAQLWEKPRTVGYRPGRVVRLTSTVNYNDGSQISDLLGTFYVVKAPRATQTGQIEVADPLAWLALHAYDGPTLCFRGAYTNEVVEWLLEYAGIHTSAHSIEDFSTRLLDGENPANPTWTYDSGTTLLDIARDLCKYALHNALLWYDGTNDLIKTGCRYCRQARTNTPADDHYWGKHQDNGWLSSGCLTADITRSGDPEGIDYHVAASAADLLGDSLTFFTDDLQISESPLDRFANVITVIGQAKDNRPIALTWRYTRSLFGEDIETGYDYLAYGPYSREYIGWKIPFIERNTNLQTTSAVASRLVELIHEKATWPLQLNDGTLPYRPDIKPGHVLKVYGGRAQDANNRIFRITKVSHQPSQRRVKLEAREMVGLPKSVTSSSSSSSSSYSLSSSSSSSYSSS